MSSQVGIKYTITRCVHNDYRAAPPLGWSNTQRSNKRIPFLVAIPVWSVRPDSNSLFTAEILYHIRMTHRWTTLKRWENSSNESVIIQTRPLGLVIFSWA